MRIVAGEFGGLRLKSPVGSRVRPTTDRVKESMFNLLGPIRTDSPALDLFAGSGALGLEALSRGVCKAYFVDASSQSLRIVSDNLKACRALERAEVWKMDWKQALGRLAETAPALSYVFVDPPYAADLWEPVLKRLSELNIIAQRVVCEHPKDVELPREVGSFEIVKQRRYGDIQISIYTPRD